MSRFILHEIKPPPLAVLENFVNLKGFVYAVLLESRRCAHLEDFVHTYGFNVSGCLSPLMSLWLISCWFSIHIQYIYFAVCLTKTI